MTRCLSFLALLVGYPLLHQAAHAVASLAWYPPAGMRFAIFLLVRPAWWLPVLAANELVDWWLQPQAWELRFRDPLWFAALLAASSLGPLLLRRRGITRIGGLASVGWLLGAMVLSSAAAALVNVSWPYRDASGEVARGGLSLDMLYLQMTLGDYLGMLILVPLALMVFRQPPDATHWRQWRRDVPLVLLPVLLLAAWSLRGADSYQTYLFIAGLCLVPVMYLSFRGSWRGTAVGLAAATAIVGVSGWANDQIRATTEGQLFIAVTGSALLVLGVAIEALRISQDVLRRQNLVLAEGNARLDELARQLRETARRNLSLSEDVRRWITGEVHDEIGQNLTALHVHVKLAESRGVPGDLLQPVRELVASMRRSVSGLLAGLRPVDLDAFGLVTALQAGTLRGTVEAAGLRYQLWLSGAPEWLDSLDNDSQTVIYRVVQEAATNTVRHAGASCFRVAIRTRRHGEAVEVVLACADDGHGIDGGRRSGGIGLRCMEDRVVSFGGRVRIRSGAEGTRILAVMVFPAGATD